MNTANSSTAFPIVARYTMTDEIARFSTVCLKGAMPRKVSGMILVPHGMFVLLYVLEIPLRGYVQICIVLLAVLMWFYLLWQWLVGRSRSKIGGGMIGDSITVRFFADRLEWRSAFSFQEIVYAHVFRVRNDSLGLVVIPSRGKGLFVPAPAFDSPAQPEFLFAYIGRTLQKK
jgi:hypothetical protein